MADNTPWGNTKITGNSADGPVSGNAQQSISAIVRAQGGLYENAFSISDPFAFAAKAAEKLDALKKKHLKCLLSIARLKSSMLLMIMQ